MSLMRKRQSYCTGYSIVYELFEADYIDITLIESDEDLSNSKSIDKFKRLCNDAAKDEIGLYSIGVDYFVSKRLSDGGLSIYTNNPNLI